MTRRAVTAVLAALSVVALSAGVAAPASAATKEEKKIAKFVKTFYTVGSQTDEDTYYRKVQRVAPEMTGAANQELMDCWNSGCEMKPYRISVQPAEGVYGFPIGGDASKAKRAYEVIFTTRGVFDADPDPTVMHMYVGVNKQGRVVALGSPPASDESKLVWKPKKKKYVWKPMYS